MDLLSKSLARTAQRSADNTPPPPGDMDPQSAEANLDGTAPLAIELQDATQGVVKLPLSESPTLAAGMLAPQSPMPSTAAIQAAMRVVQDSASAKANFLEEATERDPVVVEDGKVAGAASASGASKG